MLSFKLQYSWQSLALGAKKSIAKSAASPLSTVTQDQWPAKLPFVFLSEISNNRNGCGNKLLPACQREHSVAFKSNKEPLFPLPLLLRFYS